VLEFISLGGAGTVTGSKHLLSFEGHRLLVDCGLFQGLKNLRELNWAKFPVPPRDIDGVVLTHAHLDHSGYLPRLVKSGFHRKIYSTPATRDVAEIILKDSGFLQEKDADFLNRHGATKHHPALPLYDARDAEHAVEHFSTVEFGQTVKIAGGATLRFERAGHILGAAIARIEWGGRRIVFSGDLGRFGDPIMFDPTFVREADYIVIESTYGDRLHDQEDPVEALGEIITRTIARGGTVIIPSFAVGRAQSLLYYLWKLKQDGLIGETPIYLDSPMAIDATQIMARHPADHRLDHRICREVFSIARCTDDVEASKKITASSFPKIIIAASGMATGGRVLHHLKAFAPDEKNTIVLAGFQAAGTRGRTLAEGGKELKIHGEWIPVKAEVAQLDMLSAHADRSELIRWLSGFREAPRRVFIVHGEPEAAEALRVAIDRRFGWEVVVPRQDQAFTL
jgi:metallo-beta-lactamase family protein